MAGGAKKTYADLPDEAVAFLSDLGAGDFASAFLKKYGAAGNPDALLNLIDDVALGGAVLSELPAELQKLGVPADKANAAAAELASARLLPIAGVVGDVGAQIRKWGGKLGEAQARPKVALPKLTAEQFVDGFLAERKVVMPSDVLQNRLKLLLVSFVKGVRSEPDAVAMMGRPIKVGGLEMAEGDAKAILKGATDKLAFTKIEVGEQRTEVKKVVEAIEVKEPPALKPAATDTSPTSKTSITPPKSKPISLGGKPVDTFSEEDEKEARQVAAKANVATAPNGNILEPKSIAAAVASAAKLSFTSPDLQKRFENVVDARTRDVRDAFETRALLEAPTDKSGLGIKGATLANAVEALEKAIDDRKASLDTYAAKERERALAKTAEERRARGQATQMKEERELAKRYGEITGVVDAGTVQAAVTAQAAARPAPRVSPSTIPATGSRPKVDEIRFTSRLAGPVDELRLMSLTDFRRLSKDPVEAARRVEGKVKLLEDQGYDQKIAAVKAWRESPLHRLYLSLSEEALSAGKTLPAVAEERRAAGKEAPTAPELAAIATLNGSLRF